MKWVFFFLFVHLSIGYFIVSMDENVPNEVIFTADKVYSTLEHHLFLKRGIRIHIKWSSLKSGRVAECEKPYFCYNRNSTEYLAYPSSLFKQLFDMECFNGTDIVLHINSNHGAFFYYGLEHRPLRFYEYDLASVLLHETLHGLGIYSGFHFDDEGRLAYRISDGLLVVYDWVLFRAKEIDHFPKNAEYAFVVGDISDASFLMDGNLIFYSSYNNINFSMYSPSPFEVSASLVHRNANFVLMSFFLFRGTQASVMDVYTLSLLKEMGYATKNCNLPNTRQFCGYCDYSEPCVEYHYAVLYVINQIFYYVDFWISLFN